MRDRLIELLDECRGIDGIGMELVEKQADHLFTNGVIVPRVHVGNKVYRIQGGDLNSCVWSWTIVEICILEDELIYVDDSENIIHDDDFGDIVFLTKKEAEKALAEVANGT